MRYSAKLLFQFRVPSAEDPGKRSMRICEERIVVLEARGDRDALRKAKSRGRKTQYDYKNSDGTDVLFEFIGVRDLVDLSSLCEKDEVYYEIKTMLNPMERKDALIPLDRKLLKRS